MIQAVQPKYAFGWAGRTDPWIGQRCRLSASALARTVGDPMTEFVVIRRSDSRPLWYVVESTGNRPNGANQWIGQREIEVRITEMSLMSTTAS